MKKYKKIKKLVPLEDKRFKKTYVFFFNYYFQFIWKAS